MTSLLDRPRPDTRAQGVEELDETTLESSPETRTSRQPVHRAVFLEHNGDGPWACIFCEEDVEPGELHVHHRDEDHGNNQPTNLSATHGNCHSHHHRTGLESFERPEQATALKVAAVMLDDVEGLRKALANRERGLRAHGLLDSKAEVVLARQLEHVEAIEKDAIKELRRALKAHPLGGWVKETVGLGEKQGARLVAAIGDPAYNEAEDRPRRGPAELWAYCGYAPGQKRKRGQKSNWNADAKMRAYLCAESCMKQRTSPYRAVYDAARLSWADRDTSDGHKHAHALRLVAKAILKDIFLQSKTCAVSIPATIADLPSDHSPHDTHERAVGGSS